LFPHWLEESTKGTDTKVIHLSTDCVFSGDNGNYFSTDIPDATSFYGRTKGLGEVNNNKDLTIRLSIIGKDLKKNGVGLFNWFMKQRGTIEGYNKVLWSGITTLELAKFLDYVINTSIKVTGIVHLAPSYSISKHDLIKLIARVWKREDVKIMPNYNHKSNKTLMGDRKLIKYRFPANYEEMLIEYKEYLDEK